MIWRTMLTEATGYAPIAVSAARTRPSAVDERVVHVVDLGPSGMRRCHHRFHEVGCHVDRHTELLRSTDDVLLGKWELLDVDLA